MKKSNTKNIWRKRISIVVLAFLNALSISYITEITDPQRVFFGTEIYGWNPSCIAFFAYYPFKPLLYQRGHKR